MSHVHPISVGISVALIAFAGLLFRNTLRHAINRLEASMAVVLDMAWVTSSAIVIHAGILSTVGNWIVAFIADIVLLFAVLQYCGLRKMTRAQ